MAVHEIWFSNFRPTLVVLVDELCLILCDPMDCRQSSSAIHGISQARILEWVTISLSRRSSQPRNQTTHVACIARHILPLGHLGNPSLIYIYEYLYVYIWIFIHIYKYIYEFLKTKAYVLKKLNLILVTYVIWRILI